MGLSCGWISVLVVLAGCLWPTSQAQEDNKDQATNYMLLRVSKDPSGKNLFDVTCNHEVVYNVYDITTPALTGDTTDPVEPCECYLQTKHNVTVRMIRHQRENLPQIHPSMWGSVRTVPDYSCLYVNITAKEVIIRENSTQAALVREKRDTVLSIMLLLDFTTADSQVTLFCSGDGQAEAIMYNHYSSKLSQGAQTVNTARSKTVLVLIIPLLVVILVITVIILILYRKRHKARSKRYSPVQRKENQGQENPVSYKAPKDGSEDSESVKDGILPYESDCYSEDETSTTKQDTLPPKRYSQLFPETDGKTEPADSPHEAQPLITANQPDPTAPPTSEPTHQGVNHVVPASETQPDDTAPPIAETTNNINQDDNHVVPPSETQVQPANRPANKDPVKLNENNNEIVKVPEPARPVHQNGDPAAGKPHLAMPVKEKGFGNVLLPTPEFEALYPSIKYMDDED